MCIFTAPWPYSVEEAIMIAPYWYRMLWFQSPEQSVCIHHSAAEGQDLRHHDLANKAGYFTKPVGAAVGSLEAERATCQRAGFSNAVTRTALVAEGDPMRGVYDGRRQAHVKWCNEHELDPMGADETKVLDSPIARGCRSLAQYDTELHYSHFIQTPSIQDGRQVGTPVLLTNCPDLDQWLEHSQPQPEYRFPSGAWKLCCLHSRKLHTTTQAV